MDIKKELFGDRYGEVDEELVFLKNLKYKTGHDAAATFLKSNKKITS